MLADGPGSSVLRPSYCRPVSSDAELREQLTVANERLADALMMFESEDARLSHLADVIDELAVVLRAVDALGVKLEPLDAAADQ